MIDNRVDTVPPSAKAIEVQARVSIRENAHEIAHPVFVNVCRNEVLGVRKIGYGRIGNNRMTARQVSPSSIAERTQCVQQECFCRERILYIGEVSKPVIIRIKRHPALRVWKRKTDDCVVFGL